MQPFCQKTIPMLIFKLDLIDAFAKNYSKVNDLLLWEKSVDIVSFNVHVCSSHLFECLDMITEWSLEAVIWKK
jgi:hypothetical protein